MMTDNTFELWAMMKVILADPPAQTDDYDSAYPNLGLLHLISYLGKHTPLRDSDIVFLTSSTRWRTTWPP